MSWPSFWSRLLPSILTCSVTGHLAPPPSCLPAAGCGPSVKPGSLFASADPAPLPWQVPLPRVSLQAPWQLKGLAPVPGQPPPTAPSHYPQAASPDCPVHTDSGSVWTSFIRHWDPASQGFYPPRNGYLLPQDTCYHATASKALVSSIISQKMHWVQFYTLGYRGPPRQTSSRCSLGSGGGGVKNQHTQILFMEQEWNTSADPWRRSSDWLEKQLLR